MGNEKLESQLVTTPSTRCDYEPPSVVYLGDLADLTSHLSQVP